MYIRIHTTFAIGALFLLLICFVTYYGCSSSDVPSLDNIPRYPGATEVESMEHSSFGGFVSGSLVQFTTTDEYGRVVDFYTDALKTYKTEVLSNESELGRQTAITISQKDGGLSIAIQEFTKEGKVNITFMQVGS
jgi:hypothetical protein